MSFKAKPKSLKLFCRPLRLLKDLGESDMIRLMFFKGYHDSSERWSKGRETSLPASSVISASGAEGQTMAGAGPTLEHTLKVGTGSSPWDVSQFSLFPRMM